MEKKLRAWCEKHGIVVGPTSRGDGFTEAEWNRHAGKGTVWNTPITYQERRGTLRTFGGDLWEETPYGALWQAYDDLQRVGFEDYATWFRESGSEYVHMGMSRSAVLGMYQEAKKNEKTLLHVLGKELANELYWMDPYEEEK